MFSVSQGLAPFITQLVILIICTLAAAGATVMKVLYWRDKILEDKEAPKDLAFAITMDYIWPILGRVLKIFVTQFFVFFNTNILTYFFVDFLIKYIEYTRKD